MKVINEEQVDMNTRMVELDCDTYPSIFYSVPVTIGGKAFRTRAFCFCDNPSSEMIACSKSEPSLIGKEFEYA